MTELNMLADASIQVDDLDVEWLRHPGLVANVCGQLVVLRRKHDEAEQNLKRVESELDSDIRNDPSAFDVPLGRGDKPTESAITSAIRKQEIYIDAQKAALDARDAYSKCQNHLTVLDHRKTALEQMVRLLAMEYFSGPTAPRDLKDEFKRFHEDAKHETREQIKEAARGERKRRTSVTKRRARRER